MSNQSFRRLLPVALTVFVVTMAGAVDVQAHEGAPVINSNSDITLNNKELHSVNAARDITLSGATVRGRLNAGRDVALNRVDVRGNINAGRKLNLNAVTVTGDVNAGRQAVVNHSDINGTLTIGSDRLRVYESTIADIRIEGTRTNKSSVVLNNSSVIGNGNIVVRGGSSVVGRNGNTTISVASGSSSMVNGYSVQGFTNKTTLATPDGLIYANGKLIDGEGPATYEEFQQANPSAPSIEGPGWHSSSTNDAQPSPQDKALVPLNEIRLSGNTVVTGDITFAQGRGMVLIERGSSLQGDVIGGKRVQQ